MFQLVGRTLDELFVHDFLLLKFDASERSICGAIAAHLHMALPEYDTDVEYNRLGKGEVKRLNLTKPSGLEKECSVFPDIIVHRRTIEDNLLVIEVKKAKSAGSAVYAKAKAFDLDKLAAYRAQLGYQNALFIELPTGLSLIHI